MVSPSGMSVVPLIVYSVEGLELHAHMMASAPIPRIDNLFITIMLKKNDWIV